MVKWWHNPARMGCTRAWFRGAQSWVWLAVLSLGFTGCVAEHARVREAGYYLGLHHGPFVTGERSLKASENKAAAYLSEARRAYFLLIAGRQSGSIDAELQSTLQAYDQAVASFLASLPKKATSDTPVLRNSATSELFNLSFDSAGPGEWSPEFFQELQLASGTRRRGFSDSVTVPGVGVPLVGIPRRVPQGSPPLWYESARGFRIPVTAVVEFKRGDRPSNFVASIHLINPRVLNQVRLGGKPFVLAADFTAPMASYGRTDSLWNNFLSMIRGERTRGHHGLVFLEPYDPHRIPVVFVHGLLSSAAAWQNVANSLIRDPEIRRDYEFWVFEYPTGTPIGVSALELREDLAAVQTQYQSTQDMVLIGHSMGGLLCRMQVTNSGRDLWNPIFKKRAETLYRDIPSDSLTKRALIFPANPAVKRVIFIATPHRGSPFATGGIGSFAIRLIRFFSAELLQAIEQSALYALRIEEPARKAVFPPSVEGLSPRSPLLIALSDLPIQAADHSIIGDRGRGDTPNSSDGVVPYWSSHLASAESEVIVPYGHGAMDDPQAIAEIRRILRMHAALNPKPDRPRQIRAPSYRASLSK